MHRPTLPLLWQRGQHLRRFLPNQFGDDVTGDKLISPFTFAEQNLLAPPRSLASFAVLVFCV